jgi:adenosylcobinamide-phosphate synthase
MTSILVIILVALAFDRWLPDRGGFHLWTWYSDWAESIEERFNGGLRSQGLFALLLAIAPVSLAVLLATFVLGQIAGLFVALLSIAVLYVCIDLHRFGQLAQAVAASLENDNVDEAAAYLRDLTGKETVETTNAGVAHATVEAVLKQTSSLVVAPIFWFMLLGPFGVMLQRMASVLDRLWGHHTPQFREFGWAAARLDDVLNWVPARITALSYAVMGSFEDALVCWRQRAGMWSDINSGPVLASGLGALHMGSCEDSGEEDVYGNKSIDPADLPNSGDIRRAVALVWRVMLFWLAIGLLMTGAHLFGFFSR